MGEAEREEGEAGCGRETDVPADGAAKEGGGGGLLGRILPEQHL